MLTSCSLYKNWHIVKSSLSWQIYKATQSNKELLIKWTLLISFPFLITAYVAYLELLHWIQTWIYKHCKLIFR